MFTRVFGKTSFWSYLIAFSILSSSILRHYAIMNESDPNTVNIFKISVIGILAICSLILVEWTVRRQRLFQNGSYHLLVFSLFFWILPHKKWDLWLWVAILFFWCSLIQLMSIRGNTNSREVAFNAGFWLVFAVLFQANFCYFFLVLWLILYFKGQLNYKNILLTLFPILCIALIWAMLFVLIPNFPTLKIQSFTVVEHPILWRESLIGNFNFLLVILTAILVVIDHLKGLIHSNNERKIKTYNMILILISSILIIFLNGFDNVIAWTSFLIIVAVLSNQYFESFKKKWLVDLFFIGFFGAVFKDLMLSAFN